MKDFEGKILKIYFNNSQGWVCMTGSFIRKEDDFYIVRDNLSHSIKYLNKNFIRQIEIVGDSYEQ